ncbi:hypothetical protein J2X12_002848 [Pseudarthrobacter oxydans]|uniref:Uncharacterized protein n=1 Tax=Pseudarthrobacter oxydans TaxID=1671 RepID=A0AAW8NDL7_PSEOX|nr:hypothetical protein [Pseudarthrobacter oxydans]MDR6794837.1 hypothetical protein [Pseudarthrobacter oxydans]MDR7164810.1 hypothetical protein [Pseudarthrobacter oxydans]
MSTTINNIFNNKTLTIDRDGDDVELTSSAAFTSALFKRDDLLEALKAEGHLEDALPKGVKYRPELLCYEVNGVRVPGDTAEGLRARGLAHLAVAKYIDEQDSLAASAAKELERRRDHIVFRHAAGLGAYRYSELDVNGKYIVDTIRELEDKVGK